MKSNLKNKDQNKFAIDKRTYWWQNIIKENDYEFKKRIFT